MKFGICMFATEYAIDPVTLGRTVEGLGFDSLWFPEHTHIPTSRLSPWPGGAELPKEYSHTLDPFVAFGAVASVTENLLLGTGVTLVVERDPIVLAKEVATLDLLSNGRVMFGVGGGWNREEMENHGTDPKTRFKLLRERVEAMKALWTEDEAEYHGDLVDFDPVWAWPKPVQKPHPPIVVGGDGPRTLARVVRYGDGWIPLARSRDADFAEKIAELGRMLADAGREMVPVTMFGAIPEPEVLERHAAAGVDRCVFTVPPLPEAEMLPLLEKRAALAKQFG